MGLGRFELPTPRLSSVCSDQLSYRPAHFLQAGARQPERDQEPVPSKLDRTCAPSGLRNRAIPRPNARGIPRRDRGRGAAEHQIDLECLPGGHARPPTSGTTLERR